MRVTTTFVFVATVAVVALTERAQADSAPQIPIAEVPDPSGPNVACHGNHAGWSSDCSLIDDIFVTSNKTPQKDNKGRYYVCDKTCCAVAVHKKGTDDITESKLSIWANNANIHCNGPNLQTWRSGVEQDWKAADSDGEYKMCLCNNGSMGSC